jgi:hypothetical protein
MQSVALVMFIFNINIETLSTTLDSSKSNPHASFVIFCSIFCQMRQIHSHFTTLFSLYLTLTFA